MDPGLLRAADDGVVCFSSAGPLHTGYPVPAITNAPHDEKNMGESVIRGFVFHDSCWRLLQEASRPAPFSLQRLLDICRSLPVLPHSHAPSWGHDYGGAAVVDKTYSFPWEEEGRYDARDFSGPDPVFSADPYRVPGVDRLIAEDPQEPPPAFTHIARPSRILLGRDCFASLPAELCAAIAVLLPTADALRARLASWAFFPLFYSQQFWASTFGARRIWRLLEGVVNIMTLVWNNMPPALPLLWSLDSVLQATDLRIEATGLLWSAEQAGGGNYFRYGCRRFRTQSVAIPDNLARLSVSTAAFPDGGYIVGMSLSTLAGDHIRLGYCSPSEHFVELSHLWGFRLAIGSRGLQGLQCIAGPAGSGSPWLGYLDDVPQTDRLLVAGRIMGLEAGFDGCKMVSLAVYVRSTPLRGALPHQCRFRDAAVWYATIPPPNLCLNEDSFPQLDSYMVGYNPLFWCHFGGTGGKYPRHLTSISATSSDGLLRIHFSYNKEVPPGHRVLGRLSIVEEHDYVLGFSIDGPGGELLYKRREIMSDFQVR
ncbi:uncharacterized protein P884DRAFT_277600 [Thermothelomyces heterothallicus CBS 202.75]|uniref:uncharacterized protein n=1 Tax=Thermothelomyces heterothallicus CBS 202.75 TaxID=1149848 RepID=UPI003744AFAB